MNEINTAPTPKKVRYIASIIYLLIFAFIVGGSYINQQTSTEQNNDIFSETN